MKNPELVIIINNPLYRLALSHIFTELGYEGELVFQNSFTSCLHGTSKPKYLVLENEIIPKPRCFSLEKIISKFQNCKILVISSLSVSKEMEPYLYANITMSDSEEIIFRTFKNLFSDSIHPTISDSILSDREIEVVQLVALGKTNREISEELHISTHTVITHRKNITTKLGIKTIAGIAVYAVLNGLIDPDAVNQ